MPYYLNNASSASAAVNIPSIVVGATVGDYIEVKAVANSGNPSNNYRVIGQQAGFSNFIEIRPASAAIACGGSSVQFTTGYTQPSVGTIFTVRFTRASSTTWRCTFNDSVLGSDLFNSANLTIDCIGRFANSTTEAFRGGFYYVAISTNGGTSATRYYDPSGTSSGTTLLDTVGSQNGSQVGTWPANDSEWVFYSSGATYTLNADGGTFSYSGGIAATNYNRVLQSDGASFSYSGGAAATLYNRILPADGSVYAYSGGAASTLYNRVLVSTGANFSYSGGAANFVYTPSGVVYTLNADGATYSYSGGNASLLMNRALISGGAAFTYSGGIATLRTSAYPSADLNAFTLSYRIAGDLVVTASIGTDTALNAIISQQTTIRYAVQ